MKIAELKRRVRRPTNNIYDRAITSRVSIVVTLVLASSSVSANQISALNIFVGLTACVLLGVASPVAVLVGAFALHLYAVLDSVDGELARLRRRFSLRGLYLEDLSAFMMIVAFPLAVSLALLRLGAGQIPLVTAIIYAGFGRNGMAVCRRALIRSIQTRRPLSPCPDERPASGSWDRARRLVDDHILNHTYIRVVVSSVLVVETLLHRAPLLTAVLLEGALLALLVREATAVMYLLRDGTLDGQLAALYRDARVSTSDVSDVDPFRLAKS